jgi:hypothetical protein
MERARRLGFGGIKVVNLFALRATDPSELYRAADPVGRENDRWIVKAATNRQDDMVLCGWGSHGSLRDRDKEVLDLLKLSRINPHVLKLTRGGQPAHPLYIGYNTMPYRMGETP